MREVEGRDVVALRVGTGPVALAGLSTLESAPGGISRNAEDRAASGAPTATALWPGPSRENTRTGAAARTVVGSGPAEACAKGLVGSDGLSCGFAYGLSTTESESTERRVPIEAVTGLALMSPMDAPVRG